MFSKMKKMAGKAAKATMKAGAKKMKKIGGKAAKAAAKAAKKAACAALGKTGLKVCKDGVAEGVKKAAEVMKSKLKQLDVGAAQTCFKTFGNALCDKSYK